MTDTKNGEDKNYIFNLMLKCNAYYIILWSIMCLYYITTNDNPNAFFMRLREGTSAISTFIGIPALILISYNKLKNVPSFYRKVLCFTNGYLCIEAFILTPLYNNSSDTIVIISKIFAVIISLISLKTIKQYKENIEIKFNEKLFLICFAVTTLSIVALFFSLFPLQLFPDLFRYIAYVLIFLPPFYVLCTYRAFFTLTNKIVDWLVILLTTHFLLFLLLPANLILVSGVIGKVFNLFLGLYIAYEQKQDIKKLLQSFTEN